MHAFRGLRYFNAGAFPHVGSCICRDLATCTPSLANLVSQLLGRNLRQEGAPHDCEQDAAAAMQLVNYAIQHGVPPPMEAPQVKASAPC